MILVLFTVIAFFIFVEPMRIMLRASHEARVGLGWNYLPVMFHTLKSEKFSADHFWKRFSWSMSSAMKVVLPAFALGSHSFIAIILFLLLTVVAESIAEGSRQKWVRGSLAVLVVGLLLLAMVANTPDSNISSNGFSSLLGHPIGLLNWLLLLLVGLPLMGVHPFEDQNGRLEQLVTQLAFFGWCQLVSFWFFAGIQPAIAFFVAIGSYLLVSVFCSYLPRFDFETGFLWMRRLIVPTGFMVWILTLVWIALFSYGASELLS